MIEVVCAESVPTFSTDEPLNLAISSVTESVLPDSSAVAEGAPKVVNCLHRLHAAGWFMHQFS